MSRRKKVLSLDDATAALGAAESVLRDWQGKVEERAKSAEMLAAELAEAEAQAADDLLDDDDPEALSLKAGQLDRMRTEQGLAVQAAAAAGGRLVAAQRDVLTARGDSLRTRAARLGEVAAARSARTDQMLAALAEFEGVRFEVAMGNADGLGGGFRPRTLTTQMVQRMDWLTNTATHFDYVAKSGTDDEVSRLANSPLPEEIPVDSLTAGTVEPSEPAGV